MSVRTIVLSKHAAAVIEARQWGTNHSMRDNTQFRVSGAIIGMSAAASARPNKQNKQTTLKWVEIKSE
jgi:hypothetical protein